MASELPDRRRATAGDHHPAHAGDRGFAQLLVARLGGPGLHRCKQTARRQGSLRRRKAGPARGSVAGSDGDRQRRTAPLRAWWPSSRPVREPHPRRRDDPRLHVLGRRGPARAGPRRGSADARAARFATGSAACWSATPFARLPAKLCARPSGAPRADSRPPRPAACTSRPACAATTRPRCAAIERAAPPTSAACKRAVGALRAAPAGGDRHPSADRGLRALRLGRPRHLLRQRRPHRLPSPGPLAARRSRPRFARMRARGPAGRRA